MQAFYIDSERREIGEIEYNSLADLQRLVGGPIQVAYHWPNGDVLYVDEEGLLKAPPVRGFSIPERPDQSLAGNGVLVGPEIDDGLDTMSPTMTLDELRLRVQFVFFL